MTDWLSDTPKVSRSACPVCEPDADFSAELLDVWYCERHTPDRGGADDETVTSTGYLSGSADAGGPDNARMCDLIHRKGERP